MRIGNLLGLGLGLALLLPVEDAHALSRTVHVTVGFTSVNKSEVLVRVEGPYLAIPPQYVENPSDRTTAMVDEFGQTLSRTMFRFAPGTSRRMDAKDTITTGHTRHYTATFYERRGEQVVAFARHQWKAKMNLKGIIDCEEVITVDPEHRLEILHKRTNQGFTNEEVTAKLKRALDPREAVFGALKSGDANEMNEALVRFLGGKFLDYFVPGLGTIGNVGVVAVEGWIKNEPAMCLTQVWVMPSIPAAERVEARMFMLGGFGDANRTWVADFNGDGRPDITTARGNTLNMLLSRPEGDWQERVVAMSPQRWGNGGYNWVGDYDGDGKADLASAHSGAVYMRLAGRDFQPVTWNVPGGWGSDAYTFAGDFNGDGKTDIASADGGAVLMKISSGTGFTAAKWATPKGWGAAGYTRVGDFNGDGKADIASGDGKRVHMRLSQGSGFAYAEWATPISWGSAGNTFVGDFNGDGKDDLASANGGTIHLMLSTGSGFTVRSPKVPSNWGGAGYTFVGDFDGDGKADIASASGDRVFVKRSTGEAFTESVWTVPSWWGASGYTWVADFNGDGRADLATASGTQVRAKLSQTRNTGF